MTMQLSGSHASIIESIAFTREQGTCDYGDHHDLYRIKWTQADGEVNGEHVYWCPHPLCDTSRWHIGRQIRVMLTAWIPGVGYAYLLLVEDPDGLRLPHMEARIGIQDQWQSAQYGNYGEDWERRLFTERYFAESGLGVYRAHIVDA